MFEKFDWIDGRIRRSINVDPARAVSEIRIDKSRSADALSAMNAWDQAVLKGAVPTLVSKPRGKRRIVDLFSGAGGLSLGVAQGLSAAGYQPVVELAADLDPEALRIYERNISPREVLCEDASQLVSRCITRRVDRAYFREKPWIRDRRLAARLTGVDVLVGGPPCQGHSNLNNHTRRADPRNELYLVMPAVAVALDIPIVIIENVREVVADYTQVVEHASQLFKRSGYSVVQGTLSAKALGLPQTRNRFFLIAVKGELGSSHELDFRSAIQRPVRNLRWAIGDLEGSEFSGIHRPATLSAENRRRIDWLFEHNAYELPNHIRPKCHRNGHTYGSVYGRLHWERLSGTITTGFMSPGRGRFVHPSERRALTPHEAARIQGFPDSFHFEYPDGGIPSNKTLGKVIGDAVPPIMGQAAILIALKLMSSSSVCAEEAVAAASL